MWWIGDKLRFGNMAPMRKSRILNKNQSDSALHQSPSPEQVSTTNQTDLKAATKFLQNVSPERLREIRQGIVLAQQAAQPNIIKAIDIRPGAAISHTNRGGIK